MVLAGDEIIRTVVEAGLQVRMAAGQRFYRNPELLLQNSTCNGF